MRKNNLNKGIITGIIILFISGMFPPSIGSIPSLVSTDKQDFITLGSEDVLKYRDGSQELKFFRPPIPLDPSDAWWDSYWPYRKMITINQGLVDAAISNFPVLVSLDSDTGLAAHARDDGFDIVFTTQSGTRLQHEVEFFDGETGKLYAWVSVPNLSPTQDTILYLYYGNLGSGNQEYPPLVWDANFVMVHHLHETSGVQHDSTQYGNDGTPSVTLQGSAVGKVDGADEFDGINDHVAIPHDVSLNFGTGDFTLCAWVKYTNCIDTDIMRKGDMTNQGAIGNYKMEVTSNHISGTVQGNGPGGGGSITTSESYNDDLWHYAVFLRQSGTLRLYVDGQLKGSSAGATKDLTNPANFSIGSKDNYQEDFFAGTIDEVRLSNIARSSDWIVASYRTMNGLYISYGIEEIQTNDLQLIVTSPLSSTYYITSVAFTGTTTLNADIKYRLDGAENISVAEDVQSFSTILSGLSYATHSLVVYAVNHLDPTDFVFHLIVFSCVNKAPQKPFNPHPLNGSIEVSVNPTLDVTVQDMNGDDMDVSFFEVTSKQYDFTSLIGKNAYNNSVDTEPPLVKIPSGETEFPPQGYANIASSDDSWYTTSNVTKYPYQRFRIAITEDVSSIDSIKVVWEGHSLIGRTVTLYAWNYTSSLWQPLDSGSGATDFILTGQLHVASMIENQEAQLLVQDYRPNSDEIDFSFVWYSDTQNYCTTPALGLIYDNMTSWAAAHKTDKKIVYAIHSGDIQNAGNVDAEWLRANHSMRILENASIPWGVAAGNHDNGNGAEDWSFFNTYFGPWRFLPNGLYHNDGWVYNQNHYDLCTFDNVQFVIVYLGDGVDSSEVTWAHNVFDSYSERIGILVTHEYIGSGGAYSGDGSALYTNVVEPCENVLLVLCGHLGGAQLNTKTLGARTFYELLSNYQGVTNGGNGFFKIFYFDKSNGLVYVNTYSSLLNSYDSPYSYDEFNLSMPIFDPSEKQVSTDYIKIDVVERALIGTQTGIHNNSVASVPWTDLQNLQTYRWYTTATDTNGLTNRSEIWQFTTLGTADPWADTTCQYRKKIYFDADLNAGPLLNFPILINLSSANIEYSKTSATDIRFYDGSTLLNKETEQWNPAGYSYIWVNVPQIDNTATDYIYMYYGSYTTNLDNPTAVWTNEALVLHLNQDSGTRYDSTSNDNDGTPTGVSKVIGIIDGADSFNGASSNIGVVDAASLNFGTSSFTYSYWFYQKTSATTQDVIDKKGGNADNIYAGYKLTISSASATGFSAALGDGTTNVRLNTGSDPHWGMSAWVLCTVVVNRTSQMMTIYLNGTSRASISIASLGSVTNTNALLIGAQSPSGASRWFNGYLDEVRISTVARNIDWINTSYRSMRNQLVSYGVEEEYLFGNIPPEAADDATTVNQDSVDNQIVVLLNDHDDDSDPLTVISVTTPSHGTASIGGSGTFCLYTPTPSYFGADSFSYTVSDGKGGTDTATVFVTVLQFHHVVVKVAWNLISVPCAESIQKENIIVRWNSINYSWTEAVTNNIVLDSLYEWVRITQQYSTGASSLGPGAGYWMWAYHDCELLIPSNAIGSGEITNLDQNWNIIGLPYETTYDQTELAIQVGVTTYTWQQAVDNHIILGFIYGWDRINQIYTHPTTIAPGAGYWMYAYEDCILKIGGT